jgi:hypothetical protein
VAAKPSSATPESFGAGSGGNPWLLCPRKPAKADHLGRCKPTLRLSAKMTK